MYYAPEIDSVQSMGHLSTETSQRVYANLLEAASFSGNGIIQKQVRSTSWKKVSLEDEELDFEKSRFLCDQYKEETELHALLRHIRNAFAHGSLYVWRKKNNFEERARIFILWCFPSIIKRKKCYNKRN